MAGIPSAGGAGFAPWLTRVLLRIAMLAGLIVGGWLLSSATALAQDNSGSASPETIFADHSVESASTSLLGTVPVVGAAVPEALPAVSATLSDVASLPPLSAQRPGLDPVLGPVLHPVAAAVHPVSTGSPDPAPVAAVAPPVATPLAQAPAGAPAQITPAPAAPTRPVLAAPRAGPPAPDRIAHAPLAGQVSKDSAGRADHSAGPAPVSAPAPAEGTAPSCPAGSAGGGATTHGSQSVTLDDQRDDAEPALTQQRLRSCVDDLPRWHTQRPSTSPD